MAREVRAIAGRKYFAAAAETKDPGCISEEAVCNGTRQYNWI